MENESTNKQRVAIARADVPDHNNCVFTHDALMLMHDGVEFFYELRERVLYWVGHIHAHPHGIPYPCARITVPRTVHVRVHHGTIPHESR